MWWPFKKENTEFKIRVTPFTSEANKYVIQYKIGFKGWRTYSYSWLSRHLDYCNSLDQPYMWDDHDKAVKEAKELTLEKIIENNQRESKRYDDHVLELKNRIASRNKTTYIKKNEKHDNKQIITRFCISKN